jgi:uncharacterized Tic20 family protein
MEEISPIPPSSGMSAQDEKTWSMLAHISGIFLSLLGSLIILLLYKDKSAVVERHAKEALNFQITLAIVIAVSIPLCIILIGIPLTILAGLAGVILPIIAGLKANDGEEYKYPYILRLV